MHIPSQCKFTYNGTVITGGFAKGTMIECDFNEDATNLEMGGQGNGTFGLNEDKSGTYKIVLQAASPFNAYLESVYLLEQNGIGSAALLETPHGARGSLTTFIKKVPPLQGNSAPDSTREWEFHTDKMYIDQDALTALAGNVADVAANLLAGLGG